jgi:hypothetical protein
MYGEVADILVLYKQNNISALKLFTNGPSAFDM